MTKSMTYEYAAKEFLKEYAKRNNIEDMCLLFDKETLVEHTYDSTWEWSIKDEMLVNGCSEEEAIECTRKWFMSMTNYDLFYLQMSESSMNCLIVNKAEELGFEWEE